jgi:alpha-1,3/alpha-1,6-mannosyltransferase
MADKTEKRKTIVFFHPDLGIGGAERLVVDAAVGLQNRGHRVVIFTSHCDSKHCFDEARDGMQPPSFFLLVENDSNFTIMQTC